jgi:holo-[acyl-carrier protein] synthase
MSVLGLGIDLAEVSRIRSLLQKNGDRFKRRVFTEREIAYCDSKADPALHFAARFAAKEAASKALGTGFSGGIGWQEIETVSTESGAPTIVLHRAAAQRAESMGVGVMMVTLTHTADMAAASVVAVAKPQ